MPFALILIGLILVITAIRGTSKQFFDSLKEDFTGPNNFVLWIMAIFGLGMLGYVKPLKPLSDSFLALVLIVMTINNRNGLLGTQGFLYQIANHQVAQGTKVGMDETTTAKGGTDSFWQPLGQASDAMSSMTSPVDNWMCAGGIGAQIGITACGGKSQDQQRQEKMDTAGKALPWLMMLF
jgi:hypothetical protein